MRLFQSIERVGERQVNESRFPRSKKIAVGITSLLLPLTACSSEPSTGGEKVTADNSATSVASNVQNGSSTESTQRVDMTSMVDQMFLDLSSCAPQEPSPIKRDTSNLVDAIYEDNFDPILRDKLAHAISSVKDNEVVSYRYNCYREDDHNQKGVQEATYDSQGNILYMQLTTDCFGVDLATAIGDIAFSVKAENSSVIVFEDHCSAAGQGLPKQTPPYYE